MPQAIGLGIVYEFKDVVLDQNKRIDKAFKTGVVHLSAVLV